MDWGEWDGRTGQELKDKYGDGFSERKKRGIDLRPDGGETPREVRQRVKRWIGRVSKSGLPTGAVCHQGIIRATMSLATGWNMINPPPEDIKWDGTSVSSWGGGLGPSFSFAGPKGTRLRSGRGSCS